MNRKTLVFNIRAGMQEMGWSGRQLSDQAGLNESAVKNILNERSKYPRVDTLHKIATALETTVGEILGEAGAGVSLEEERLLQAFNNMAPANRERLIEVAGAWGSFPENKDAPNGTTPDDNPRKRRTILRSVE